MSSSLNKVFLIGNLGQKPELRTTNNNNSMVSFSLATNERFKNQQNGQFETRTEWHRCVAFDRQAEIMAQFLDKGSKIFVEGKLKTNKYTDQNGLERESVSILVSSITMLDSKNSQVANNLQDDYLQNNPTAGYQPKVPAQTSNNQSSLQPAGGFGNNKLGGFAQSNGGFGQGNNSGFGKPSADKASSNPSTNAIEDELPF